MEKTLKTAPNAAIFCHLSTSASVHALVDFWREKKPDLDESINALDQSVDGVGRPSNMPGKLVESVNGLDAPDFFKKYLAQDTLSAITSDVSVPEHERLRIVLTDAGRSIPAKNKDLLEQCLWLIESTSAQDYRNSEGKWSASRKRKEMRFPDMRYVILVIGQGDGHAEAKVAGFVSFMITYEDGREVVYCYEIHLDEPYQGQGVGKKLMAVVEGVGRNVGVEKCMLTVFKANKRAVKMYERLGYSEDEFSPAPRKLRNGTVKEASYMILSKDLRTAG